ncbi:hypothetical protein A3D00_05390 [Candidatus Woesebacteria bacterium RIFCSPHIGHO2_02_FULL_38_9]|uniref:Bacterial Ig-like domain-containing protein n=1 Tax=Candidatus Woesebacteria bacterium RIFCSPHIGHO2_01_FULL_39_28 TaxID=1802496 RepID=A0A1F7YCN0_9BACT|nr:MAG: hypothetical protein A2627_03160 [Candidatus Woesebacteria bacterium RIFCSPHIGHO2_01_FULL_39_28]OGM35048.1 MAG: hypothetical protein A3D00_05390 [Candidatus Woesebacteria bacterium RIFCSPHIGHO2_02_FULL_38_9]OGM58044.1 MAG: hypothetical protein A3A50_02170 [Candidatus Woesebacteria bacterium RIFCSPLOWO2_01_FULL_38_20]
MRRKYLKTAIFFGTLTIATITLVILVGVPAIAKLTSLLSNLNKSSQLIEQNDTNPPPPPRINTPTDATNKFSIDINGSSEPGSSVEIFWNDNKDEVLAGSDGGFSFNFKLRDGENTLYATAKDNFGNESQKSQEYKITLDNKPPTLEITKPKDGTSFFGSHQRLVSIEGKTENNASVIINDRLIIVNESGAFSYATTLNEDENHFTVKTTDKAGNSTEQSLTVNFTL